MPKTESKAMPDPFKILHLYTSLANGNCVRVIFAGVIKYGAHETESTAVNNAFGSGKTVMFLSTVSLQPCCVVPIKRTASVESFCNGLV